MLIDVKKHEITESWAQKYAICSHLRFQSQQQVHIFAPLHYFAGSNRTAIQRAFFIALFQCHQFLIKFTIHQMILELFCADVIM